MWHRNNLFDWYVKFNVINLNADEEAPSITCPDNITVATDVGASSAIITWAGPFASDNTGQATAVTDISLGLWPIGIQTVTGTAVDGSGNEAQCTFWVNVQGEVRHGFNVKAGIIIFCRSSKYAMSKA